MARAILAFNTTIHSGTGIIPLEGMFRWKRNGETDEVIWEKLETGMVKRNEKENRSKADSRYHDIKIGDQVFVVNACKRLKMEPRHLGPYTDDEKLTRY